MPPSYYDHYFPNHNGNLKQTSLPDNYNCIAYAAGDTTRFWWPPSPASLVSDFWPPSAPPNDSIHAFAEAFSSVGYRRCRTGRWEWAFEKIAIYAIGNEVKHAARQQIEDGKWRSKLGPDEDVEHPLSGLEGWFYGYVVAYMKRPIPDRKLTSISRIWSTVADLWWQKS
jgi:hypothetical protein